MNATFYAASPYHWEVVGWMSDISKVTKQEMIDYRSQFYRPDNATLVLVGDVDPAKIMPLVTRYSRPDHVEGQVAARAHRGTDARDDKWMISQNFNPPYIEKRVTGKAATNPNVTLMFHIPPMWGRRPARALRAGPCDERAHRQDVHGHGREAAARDQRQRERVQLGIRRALPGQRRGPRGPRRVAVPLDQVEKEWSYIEDAKKTPVDANLLQRIKNSVERSTCRAWPARASRGRWPAWKSCTAGSTSRISSRRAWP